MNTKFPRLIHQNIAFSHNIDQFQALRFKCWIVEIKEDDEIISMEMRIITHSECFIDNLEPCNLFILLLGITPLKFIYLF